MPLDGTTAGRCAKCYQELQDDAAPAAIKAASPADNRESAM